MQKIGYDYFFKIILVGCSGVGKSSVLTRYTEDYYQPVNHSTIGVDFKVRTIERQFEGKIVRVRLQIWDTAGQERFRTITKSYYRTANAIILMYDQSKYESFQEIEHWYSEAKQYSDPNVLFFCCGNKMDSVQNIDKIDVDDMMNFWSIKHFEVSAKNNIGINTMFDHIVDQLLVNQNDQNGSNQLPTVLIDDQDDQTKNIGCC